MADFHQNGVIATLHRLGPPDRPALEADLSQWCGRRPLALIIPALAADLMAPAMAGILAELAGASYVGEVIVSLGRAGKRELAQARRLLEPLPQECLILHNQGRAQERILDEAAQAGLSVGQEGKGRAVWLALGLALARGKSRVAAMHDSDIADYDRLLLARLVHPLLNPMSSLRLAKGYYARYTHQLFGRVTRLFMGPALAVLEDLLGARDWLSYLRAFRYPLAGEVALDLEAAWDMELAFDWGLETHLLAEARRRLGQRAICQVDLAESYEHKHQELSQQDPHKGLARMAGDISLCLLRELTRQGQELSQGFLRSLVAAYPARARDFLEAHAAEAAINGLAFDWAAETKAVRVFQQALGRAVAVFLDDGRLPPLLSPWRQVLGALPGLAERLMEAVEADNR